MSQRMAEAGADAVMVITPYYFKNAMTNDALEQHFTKVPIMSRNPQKLIARSFGTNDTYQHVRRDLCLFWAWSQLTYKGGRSKVKLFTDFAHHDPRGHTVSKNV